MPRPKGRFVVFAARLFSRCNRLRELRRARVILLSGFVKKAQTAAIKSGIKQRREQTD
jgi:hypothetical protein